MLTTDQERQLDLIGYIDEEMESLYGNRLKYRVAGGWAVDGVLGKVTRPHDNVDVMVPRKNLPRFEMLLEDYGMEIRPEGRNRHAEGRGVVADVVVLYPIGEDYAFETPYHNPGAPIPKRFLKGKRVKLEGIKFTALNPTALYFAKITAKERCERDLKDAKNIARYVDEELKKDMMAYAKV